MSTAEKIPYEAPNGNTKGKRRTSQILRNIAEAPDEGTISVGRFVEMLGDRSFALVILIFSLPNSLPVPGIPGFSTVTGIPILLIALQVMYGRHAIWLPKKVGAKSFSHAIIAKIIHKALPVIEWLEKYIRPRVVYVCEGYGERLIGLLIFTMALILTLPIIGGNFLPGFSITLMALALLENDGLFAIFSMAFTVFSIWFMYQVIVFVLEAAYYWVVSFI